MILEGPSFFPVACQVRTLVSQRNGSPKYCLIGKDSTISRGVSHEGRNSSDGASRGSRKDRFLGPSVLAWGASAEGHAVCPGADERIRPRCDGSASCKFAGVAAPGGSFGLLVLRLAPPLFGAPRHDVLDAAVFTRSSDDPQALENRQIRASLQALARCIAPSGGRIAERRPVPILARQTCDRASCRLGESSVTLLPGLSRTAQQP